MKGFFALPLALASVALIALVHSAASADAADAQRFVEERERFEQRLLEEVQAKALLRNALDGAHGSTREEKLLNAAMRTATVAEFYAQKNASAWMGSPSDTELRRLLHESAAGNAHACDACIPLNAFINGTPAALAILDENEGSVFISRNGFSHLPIFLGEEPGIGIIFAHENHSFVAWASEGFP